MAIKLKKLVLGVFTLAAMFGVSFISNPDVYADQPSDNNSIYLQIAPVKQKLKLVPGQSQVSSIKVRNIGTDKFTYRVSVVPYSVVDEKYNANYENKNDYTKIYNWIKIDKKLETGTLEPGEEIDVPFTITVPSDLHFGGQYAAIMAETSDGGGDENSVIKTINRLGMILYADVTKGEINIDGKIINNTVNSFILEPPLTVSATVENTGNFETTATYTVKIWPFGSSETIYNNEENPVKLDIIPKTRRYNSISWEEAPRLGIFTVEQKVEYPGIEASVVRKLVIICPLWFAILLFIIVAVLIIWLVSRIVKRKKGKINNN